MANFVTIEAEARARAGKGAARATRRAGKVPAVIYGAKQAHPDRARPARGAARVARGGWRSRLYELKLGGESHRALMRDVQFHPVTDRRSMWISSAWRRRADPRRGGVHS
jgi:large subunit ribosomal protein L25